MKYEVVARLAERTNRFSKFVRRRITINRAHFTRSRNRNTRFVAVTGSSGKTTLSGMLDHILSGVGPTVSRISQNTMPTIAPFIRDLGNQHDFAVVETAIDATDRMLHLAKLIRPHIAVVTMIRLEHKKTMPNLEIIAREKGYLIEHMAPGGIAVLNADDEQTDGLAQRANGKVVTFGQSADADYCAVEISADYPDRLSLSVCNSELRLKLQTQLVGAHFWLPVTAAVAVAHQLGVPSEIIADRIASFESVVGRCSVLHLSDDRHFIMDTYKAPQHSLACAFEIARTAQAPRRRIVLGQMSDTTGGGTTVHRKAYRLARGCADEIIFVGDHAHRHNAPQEDVDGGRIVNFKEVREAADYLRRTSTPGELVLLKSNSKMHLERAALAQDEVVKCWGQNCKLKIDCKECGLYGLPYETHLGEKPARTD